jgi:hypothetical protein
VHRILLYSRPLAAPDRRDRDRRFNR